MSALFQVNEEGSTPDIEISIVTDYDNGIFLSILGETEDKTVFDLICINHQDIDAFFEMVEQARVEYVRLQNVDTEAEIVD